MERGCGTIGPPYETSERGTSCAACLGLRTASCGRPAVNIAVNVAVNVAVDIAVDVAVCARQTAEWGESAAADGGGGSPYMVGTGCMHLGHRSAAADGSGGQ